MSEKISMSGLNLQFFTLFRMLEDFRKNNNSVYFEDVEEDEIPFRKIALIKYKIHQILNLMLDYSYYYDTDDVSVDCMMNILQNAFAYIEELSDCKLDKEE